ncbi:MAG: dTMP kinase [Atopostipes suicloacalis]|nr:dTMP kinase [Atopostipes suicloacalis]
MRGLFITVEGPDGSGKTSLVKELSRELEKIIKVPLIITREPGGSNIAEKIREVIIDPNHPEMDDRTEALLFAASRRQHIIEKIKPALNAGKVVLCDRFVDSSIAYQGAGREIGVSEVASINQFATEDLTPDLTLYLDVDAQVGLNRIGSKHSNREKDRLELETITFHNRVRSAYLKLLNENSERIYLIDASQEMEAVLEDSLARVKEKLKENGLLKTH